MSRIVLDNPYDLPDRDLGGLFAIEPVLPLGLHPNVPSGKAIEQEVQWLHDAEERRNVAVSTDGEAKSLATEEDMDNGEEDQSSRLLPSGPRLPVVLPPQETPWEGASPLSVRRAMDRLAGKHNLPHWQFSNGIPSLLKPMRIHTDSLRHLDALKEAPIIAFDLDLEEEDFRIVYFRLESKESEEMPVDEQALDILTLRVRQSSQSHSNLQFRVESPLKAGKLPIVSYGNSIPPEDSSADLMREITHCSIRTSVSLEIKGKNVTATFQGANGIWLRIGCPVLGMDLLVWKQLACALHEHNNRHRQPTPDAPLQTTTAKIGDHCRRSTAARLPPAPPIGPDALFAANLTTSATVRALIKTPWPPTDEPGYAYGLTESGKQFQIFFGIPEGKASEPLLSVFARGGVPMVKTYYALWARWYASGGKPREYVTVDLNQFCDDLGYKRHHKGGHLIERKKAAVECVCALTTVEMQVTWHIPNGKKGKKTLRFSGQLWQRGILAEQQDRYADLFGASREGDPNLWEPVAFRFAPGDWFSDEAFSTYAKAVGRIGAGLLRLDNHIDSWPILIGGYFGTVIRANKYETLRIRAETILYHSNLAQDADERRRSTQYREKFERAMDRLSTVGVIAEWTWEGIDTTEPDFDDAAALAAYGANEGPSLARNSWRNQMMKITWPEERKADRDRLQQQQKTAIDHAQRNARGLTKQRDARAKGDEGDAG